MRLVPYLCFLLSPFVVFPWEGLRASMIGSITGDELIQMLPMLRRSAERLLGGHVLWSEGLFFGIPLIPEPNFSALYPPKLLVLVGDPLTGYGLYVGAHVVLAQATAYRYLRALGAARAAAVFGGLAYGYSVVMVAHLGHQIFVAAAAWTPAVFAAIHRASRGGARRFYAAGAVAVAMHALAGALQFTFYLGVMVLFFHALVSLLRRDRRPFVAALLVLLPGALLASLQVLPSLEVAPEAALAARGSVAFQTERSLPVAAIVGFWMRLPSTLYHLHWGAVVAVAIAGGVVAGRRRAETRAFAWLGLAALLLMLGDALPWVVAVTTRLPVVNVFRDPVRHAYELSLAGAVLAGLGADAVVGRRRGLPGGAGAWLAALGAVVAGGAVVARFIAERVETPLVPDLAADLALPRTALPLAAGAVAVAALAFGARMARRRWLSVAVLALAMLAEIGSGIGEGVTWWDHRGALARADFRGPGRPFARLLPVAETPTPASLAANLPLLFPRMATALGYSPAAPRDVARLLGTDYHGNPARPLDLALSRLAETYGVSHVVTRPLACSPGLARPFGDVRPVRAPCPRAGDGPLPVGARPVGCTLPVAGVAVAGAWAEVVAGGGEDGAPAPQAVGLRLTDPLSGEAGDVVLRRVDGGAGRSRYAGRVPGGATPGAGVAGVAAIDDRPLAIEAVRLRALAPRLVARASRPGRRALRRLPAGSYRLRLEAAPGAPAAVLSLAAEGESVEVRTAPGGGVAARTIDLPEPVDAATLRLDAPPQAPAAGALEALLPGSVVVRAGPEVFGDTAVAGVRRAGGRVIVEAGAFYPFVFALPLRPLRLTAGLSGRLGARARLGFVARAGGADLERVFGGEALAAGRVQHTFAIPAAAAAVRVTATAAGASGAIVLRAARLAGGCDGERFPLVRRDATGVEVRRVARALPRAYTARRVFALAGGPRRVAAVIGDDPRFVPGETAIVPAGTRLPRRLAPGRVRSARFTPERARIDVEAPGGATLLVVNDRFHRMWRAEIDGAPAPILRVNGLVRGVVVPAGRHRVVMRPRPTPAMLAGLVAAILAAGLLLGARRLHRRLLGGGREFHRRPHS